jgi:serine phosphatase RsbU (regulator of sigma subunit)
MSGSSKAPSVLIVDDEEMVLSSLRGVFTLQTDYDLFEAKTPKAAIEQLERRPIDVVISDFLMPGMNGIELLKEVKKIQPDSARLLLTGYADKENAIKAINEVGIYHYLEKPWDNDALLNIVRRALEEKSLRRELTVKIHELDALFNRHGELEAKHRFLEKELEMAAKVQRSMLPKHFPEVTGFRFANLYQPCETIGGDFFDIVVKGANEDEAVLLVADVIGHGVQAALSTMLLKSVFRESVSDIDRPVDLLDEMNRRLYAVLPSGMNAAAAVFFLSSSSPEISYANAGLPYPFVLRANEKRVDEIVLAGAPLGLIEPGLLPYECRKIVTREADVMLSGSDGLGSIQRDDGAMFDDDALRRGLAQLTGRDGDAVIQEIRKQALAFGNDEPIPDDVNLVAITRTR